MPWSEVRFESKEETHQSLADWVQRLLSDSKIAKKPNEVGIKKALTQAQTVVIHRRT